MKIYFYNFFLIIIFSFPFHTTIGQQLFTIGPTVHFRVGDKFKPAYGLEFAYWDYEHFPYSVDLGIEYEKSKFRIYSEAQTGIAVTGFSAGPVLEFAKQTPVKLGLQGTAWLNYFIGVDYRFRIMSGSNYYAPGVYAKFLWLKGGTGSNNNTSHHHHFDWD